MNRSSRRISLAVGITAIAACLASPLLVHKAAAQTPALPNVNGGGFAGGGFGGFQGAPYKPTAEEAQSQKDSLVFGTPLNTVSDGHGRIVVTYQSGFFAIISPDEIDSYFNAKTSNQRRGFRLFRPHADGSVEELTTLKTH